MADTEKDLISRVILDGDLTEVVESQVTASYFANTSHAQVWDWVLDHWTTHSKVPGRDALKSNYPTWRPSTPEEPIGYYIEELVSQYKQSIMLEVLATSQAAIEDGDPDGAEKALKDGARELDSHTPQLRNDVITQGMDDDIALYEEFAANPGKLRGLSTGFRTIDRATRGIQAEQYIVIIGAPKSGKSTVLMQMAIHLNEQSDARLLLLSFEMSREEQKARHNALRAKVSHTRLLDGRMTAKDKRALYNASEDAKQCADLIMVTDISATTTVSGVRAQVEREKPDVVLIDGAYLMQDEEGERQGSSQAVTNISRGMKRMAQATRIPVVVTTQALESKMTKSSGVTAYSAGYSSAWNQDCDVMLGIQALPEAGDTISELKVLLSRSGPLARTRLDIKWDEGTIEELEAPGDEIDDGGPTTY